MSDLESDKYDARVPAHKPIVEAQLLGNKKQCTLRDLLMDIKDFANDFKEHRQHQLEIQTPQANMGIGPVKYKMELQENRETSIRKLKKLNKMVKLEKKKGDKLIKFDAALLFLATGQEDPWEAIPAFLRSAARAEIKEYTRRCLQRTQIARMMFAIPSAILPFIHHFDSQYSIANGAEGALIWDLSHMFFEQLRGCEQPDQLKSVGIRKTLSGRHKDKFHVLVSRYLMREIFQESGVTSDDDEIDCSEREPTWEDFEMDSDYLEESSDVMGLTNIDSSELIQ